MKLSLSRTVIILLFVITFVAIGWGSPVLYATYAPQEEFLEVNKFAPQDATVDSESHLVCFDRTVREPTTADVQMEMILVDGENGTEVYSRTFRTYFEKDSNLDALRAPLPDDIRAGEYKYEVIVALDLANNRVNRQVSWTSEPFTVHNSTVELNSTRGC